MFQIVFQAEKRTASAALASNTAGHWGRVECTHFLSLFFLYPINSTRHSAAIICIWCPMGWPCTAGMLPVLIKLHCKKDGREILLPATKKCFQVTFISFVANCSFFFNFYNHKCYCAAVSRKNQYLSTTSLPKLTEIRLFNGQKALFNHTMVLPPFLCTHCGLTHFKLNGPFLWWCPSLVRQS